MSSALGTFSEKTDLSEKPQLNLFDALLSIKAVITAYPEDIKENKNEVLERFFVSIPNVKY